MEPRYLTTHRIARLLGVSLPSVANWIDRGLLPAHRTPGGHRRVAHADLVQFCQDQSIPLPVDAARDDTGGRVLVVDHERDFAEMVRDALVIEGLSAEVADTAFSAGLSVGRFRPHVVLLDLDLPDLDPLRALEVLRETHAQAPFSVVAWTAAVGSADARVARAGFDAVLEKPIELGALTAMVGRLLAR